MFFYMVMKPCLDGDLHLSQRHYPLGLFSYFWFLNHSMLLKSRAFISEDLKKYIFVVFNHSFPLPKKKKKSTNVNGLTVSWSVLSACFLGSVSITQKYTQGVTTLHIYQHAWCNTTITTYPLKLAMNHTEMLYMYRLLTEGISCHTVYI